MTVCRPIVARSWSPSELQELLNTFGLALTEKQIIPPATVDDIDFGAVRAFMRAQGLDPDEAPQPAREDDLRNGSIVDELDGVLRYAATIPNPSPSPLSGLPG